MGPRRISPLAVVVAIVLVDLLGFTIVMPLLPRFADEYGFSKGRIGWLLAAYPLCQLVAAPVLGRLSDRYGRRPVLAASQAGTALSFAILALSRDYTTMLLARMLDGASGGNILVAQAYVADVTRPGERSRGLGLIGAAFGLGFVLGPILGGAMLSLPVSPAWRLRVPFLAAAGFSTMALVLVLARLPESRPPGGAGPRARVATWRGLVDVAATPGVGLPVLVGALVVLAFASLEGTLSLYLAGRLGWSAGRSALAFALLGVASAAVQGGLIRRLAPRFGEPPLIAAGLGLLVLGLAGLAGASGPSSVLVALVVVGVGQGFASPTIQGHLSRVTPAAEQGAVFGVLASAQTIARMTNYVVGNRLLGAFGPSAPYWEGAAVALVAAILAIGMLGPGRRVGASAAVDPEPVALAGAESA